MARKILITGAGSGLGEGATIGLARNGHHVIAAAHAWPQVTALRAKAEALGLPSLRGRAPRSISKPLNAACGGAFPQRGEDFAQPLNV
jgi:NAD(P)-dependent dehydrogenase (short-subunit alcohol dehydrogenase family)